MLRRTLRRMRPLRCTLFDLDSTVLTVCGHQEQASVGYTARLTAPPKRENPGLAYTEARRGLTLAECKHQPRSCSNLVPDPIQDYTR